MTGEPGNLQTQAREILASALGGGADFRPGQWAAISAVIEPGSRRLIVQRTGWGKSVVYFLATRLIRDRGGGVTVIVSPLLALMRNQIDLAERFGLRAASINSTNREAWEELTRSVLGDEIDLLLVSPERLANEGFREALLPHLERRCGLLVIDEAHCISDWGHDFRPNYRRILGTVRRLNPQASILATTATANDRVIDDLGQQLGGDLRIQRGPLMRPSLRLSVFRLRSQAERLAFLSQVLPRLRGTGIIYTLTVNDSQRVAHWLHGLGIDARAYHADLPPEQRLELEDLFARSDLKALVATTALGMGYDKPDVAFVIHFQRPGSIIAYYQQAGRAGRALDSAHCILLEGAEDDEIGDHFIDSAFPPPSCFDEVLAALRSAPLTGDGVLARTNQRHVKVRQALELLDVEGVIRRQDRKWILVKPAWTPDRLRASEITAKRRLEADQMRRYVTHAGCRMEFLARALDDPTAQPCGRCDNCRPHAPPALDQALIQRALRFLKQDRQPIVPRAFYPPGFISDGRRGIPEGERLLRGVALCVYNDAGWGALVRRAKYERSKFPDELIAPSVEAIRSLPEQPAWAAWVPSLERTTLVPDFAGRLAKALGIPSVEAVKKTRATRPQKEMQNSPAQFANVRDAFEVTGIRDGVCLLVDDVIDSGWTMTAIGAKLRQAGAGAVVPFALATARPRLDR